MVSRNIQLRTYVESGIVMLSVIAAIIATYFYYMHGYVVAYGDAESHLNIAKRVIESPTAGLAQLGGVWLPLAHIILIPFVYFDFLWYTGLAGSIVSGISFVIAALFIYKTAFEITEDRVASCIAAIIFIANPNALYLQSTAMTEVPLMASFALATYYFVKYLKNDEKINSLLVAAFFGFCATLIRYDGWFLVLFMVGILGLKYFPWSVRKLKIKFDTNLWHEMQGRIIIFSTLAFFGVFLWFAWDYAILGDPLYFTHSEFSAKSQQNALLSANQLPAYHNIVTSLEYYFVTSLANIGSIIFLLSIFGFIVLLFNKGDRIRFYIAILFSVMFIFNVYTLYAGQSVIFIPEVNPDSFKNNIFNVRYGIMMLPFAAIFFAYLFAKSKVYFKIPLVVLLLMQFWIFAYGNFEIITLTDGIRGISSSIADEDKIIASNWMREQYSGGYVLMDDYARPISIIESRIPMKNIVYIGSKPIYENALTNPQNFVEWVVLKGGDSIYKNLYTVETSREKLETYFTLVYESGDRKIYKRNNDI